ncbi:MAG: hypothetical protein PHN69_03430 [Candidatus Pacebacteria bacterium]|nr:hypothetical protein [Candidatus Paceibacterota bacterium]
MLNNVIVHSIGSHPVTFGEFPNFIPHPFHHLEDIGTCGINMPLIFAVRAKYSMPDTHLVHSIRGLKQIPATIEVISSLNQLGFENLRALVHDKPELWVGGERISLACLGSMCIVGGEKKGVVFHIDSTGTRIEYFSARDGRKSLPKEWIFPSIVRAA